MSRILTPQQKIERSIVTDFRRDIWNKFVMGYERYDMIKPGDKIAVCISGGKDSMLLAKCMQHLQKYQGMDIGLEFIVMNPGYSDANRQRIIDNAGTIDCIWNGLSVSDERKKVMLMSEPYMKNEMVFVVNGSSDVASQADLAGKNIAVQNGSTAQETLLASDVVANGATTTELATNDSPSRQTV